MTVSPTLMQAILAMDVYHQGGDGLDHKETQIGTAILSQESDISADSEAVAAGFYAAAYDWNFRLVGSSLMIGLAI